MVLRSALVPLAACLCLALCWPVQAAPRTYVVDIHLLPPPGVRNYYLDLLSLILNASKAPDEVIEFRFAERDLRQQRWIAEVESGRDNSLLWTITSDEREASLRPIRYSLFKDLLSYRYLVIRPRDAETFAGVQAAGDLTSFVAGQGEHWPDIRILQANGLRVTTGSEPEHLYRMLVAGRFDYFPRGATEVFSESDIIRSHGLMVAPQLALHYPAAMYFFVNKKNEELAGRLERGWQLIIASGEFDRLFFSVPRVQQALARLAETPRIIRLRNPLWQHGREQLPAAVDTGLAEGAAAATSLAD